MGLLGRYTTYVGAANAAHTLLAKLFGGPGRDPFTSNGAPIKEQDAQVMVQAWATADPNAQGQSGLQPSKGIQQGDPNMFPNGVDMTFAGSLLQAPNAPPDVSTVKWTNPGDPANPYIPDITSPGPGLTGGTDKTVDPQISISDIEQPFSAPTDGSASTSGFATNSDPSYRNIENPVSEGPAVASNNKIGSKTTLGSSGG